MKKKILLPLLLLGSLATASVAVAQTTPPPAQYGDAGPHGGPGGPGGGHRPPMITGLDQVNLSDAQHASIQQIMQSHHEEMRSMRQSEMQQHRSFETLDPAAPTYAAQVNVIAQQSASLASQRIQQTAAIKTQIYGVLTGDQKAQLANIVANMPAPPPPQD